MRNTAINPLFIGESTLTCAVIRLRPDGMVAANDDDVGKVAHRRWPTRDAAPRLSPVQEVHYQLIMRREVWPALFATMREDGNGWDVDDGKYYVPRNPAENPIDRATGKRIDCSVLFCRLAKCTQAELIFVADKRLELGLDLSELEEEPVAINVRAERVPQQQRQLPSEANGADPGALSESDYGAAVGLSRATAGLSEAEVEKINAARPGMAPLPDRKQEEGVIHDLEVFDAGEDSEDILPREWLFGAYYALSYFGGLIGDGGVGKTALRFVHYLSMCIGRSLTGDHLFCRSRILIVCLEDDRDEVRRRIKAAMIHYGISRAELRGWLFYAVPKGIKLVELVDGSPAAGQLEGMIRRAVKRWDISVVSFDPLIKLHSVDENNNSAMDFVADLLTRLASELHIAADTCIHTKKGIAVAGDVDAGRGAGSVKNAGRLMYTATRMTVAEAELFGIGERERLLYIRHDSAKVNLAPPSQTAQWFKLVGIPLGNGNEKYPSGDTVQTVELWKPPEMWEGVSIFVANAILDDIERGLPNGSRYSNHHKAGDREARHVIQHHVPEKNDKAARRLVAEWIENEILYEEDYLDPSDSKTRKGLRLNFTKRPGTILDR